MKSILDLMEEMLAILLSCISEYYLYVISGIRFSLSGVLKSVVDASGNRDRI